ncbi:hypothetical protein OG218_03595 [Kineococcus sp. NBC_00420]|uniref:hypothetical protein n=1 Tax=Kineococcus sp. NBC_00420 TaxID=2903564 RepID=UPI002E1EFA82
MRRWDPLQEQDNRQQRRIAAAGPPVPSTADVAGFEDYPCFYVKLRRGRVLDSAGSFEEIVRSARGGWAAGTTVTATHLAPDRHPVLLLEAAVGAGGGAEYGARCGATRWVADVPGSATAGLVGALRTLHAFDALPELSIQRGGVIGSTAARTQAAWLSGETRAGVDGFRVQCPRPSGHEGLCVVHAVVGDVTWSWDREREVIIT